MKIDKLRIIFSGYSINNAPRVKLLEEICEANGIHPYVYGVVKNPKHTLNYPTYIRHHGNKTGLMKIIQVFKNIFCVYNTIRQETHTALNYAINPISGMICYLIYKTQGTPYVYDSQEMFFGVQHSGFNSLIKNINIAIEKRVIENAKMTLFSDEFRRTFTRRFYHLKTTKLGYLYNASSVDRLGKEKSRKKINAPKGIIVSYCGGVTLAREIDKLVEGFLQANIHDMYLYLVGNIEKEAEIKIKMFIKSFPDAGSRIVLTGEVTNSILKTYMEASDVTFAFYKPDSLNNRYCSPNKLFDAIALRTFIISSPCPLVKKLVGTYNVGMTLRNVSPDIVSEVLRNFKSKVQQPARFNEADSLIGWHVQRQRLEVLVKNFCETGEASEGF